MWLRVARRGHRCQQHATDHYPRANAALAYTPVGLVDVDPRKKGLRVGGVKVLGSREDLTRILRPLLFVPPAHRPRGGRAAPC